MRIIKLMTCSLLGLIIAFALNVSVQAKDSVTIVIDPGHGGPATVDTNLGACYNGLVESDVNLALANALKIELEQYGNVKVFMTRTDNSAVDLKTRIAFAKSVGADFVVSVHHNASSSHLLYGSEIFVPCGSQYAQGYSLASCIMQQWVAGGLVDKGIKTRIGTRGDYYGLIRHGATYGVPTIILEHGYIDNYHDLSSLDGAEDRARLAKQDAAGIAAYYGLKKGTRVASVSPKITAKNPKSYVPDDVTAPILTMVVNSYNKETGEVNYTLTAVEPESRVYLYGFATTTTFGDNNAVVANSTDLSLWNGKGSVSGTFKVTPGYAGPFCATCYNNYNVPSNLASAMIGF